MGDSPAARRYVREAARRVNRRYYETLSRTLQIPYIHIPNYLIDPYTAKILTDAVCKRYIVLPLSRRGHRLVVAHPRPLSRSLVRILEDRTGLEVKGVLAPRFHILEVLCDTYC